MLCLIDRKIL